MRITEKVEGRLLILTADNDARHELARAYRGESDVTSYSGYPAAEMLLAEWGYNGANGGLQFLPPERIPEAMTDMPLLADWTIEDDDSTTIGGPVWGFPDYCILDPWAILRDHGRVVFDLVASYPEEGATLPPVGEPEWIKRNADSYDNCLGYT